MRLHLLLLLSPLGIVMWRPANAACIDCHKQQALGFLQTGMGRSMTAGMAVSPAAPWNQRIWATRFAVDRARQSIERGGFTASYPAAVTIGSGNHAFGFLVRQGEHVFQSPLSWYARRRAWDVAPGYEANAHPDFNRPVVAECLFCHSNRAQPAKDSLNRYAVSDEVIAEPISCERCHGEGNAHMRAPGKDNIVNPMTLSRDRRDAVCEQCHLGGEARILSPGRTWHDFKPGDRLEDTFTAFTVSSGSRFKVVGHVEQLALSQCAERSAGRLWCGTCHDPHSKPAEPAAHYRARCLACHESARHQKSVSNQGDCVACHMPRRQAPDSGHAAFTDHRIRRPGADLATPLGASKLIQLTAWRAPEAKLASRNLGLAYASLGEKEQSTALLAEAGRLLSPLVGAGADPDAETLAALGLVRLLQDQPKEAVLLLERAVAARPAWAPYYQKLAIAWKAAGNLERAVRVARRAIEIDPSIEGLYHTLAALESASPAARRTALEKYLEFAPQSVVTREAIGAR